MILVVAYRRLRTALQEAQQLKTDAIQQRIVFEKNKELQHIFMQAPMAIAILSIPGFVVKVANETTLELWGKSYDEVVNRPFFEISPRS